MNEAQRYLLDRHLGDFPVNKFEKDYTKLVYISDVMMDFVDDVNSKIKQLEADKLEMAKAIVDIIDCQNYGSDRDFVEEYLKAKKYIEEKN